MPIHALSFCQWGCDRDSFLIPLYSNDDRSPTPLSIRFPTHWGYDPASVCTRLAKALVFAEIPYRLATIIAGNQMLVRGDSDFGGLCNANLHGRLVCGVAGAPTDKRRDDTGLPIGNAFEWRFRPSDGCRKYGRSGPPRVRGERLVPGPRLPQLKAGCHPNLVYFIVYQTYFIIVQPPLLARSPLR